ncbi:PorT family protein [Flavobacterium circumlabens]|uniref:Outer membrane protein with beta-barrel domain n=1 Tax=Flavobacterium circumlabens TaxID=2133765 RepID=A0A4Y7UHU3_9FLAO|nr:porin family protein [Flavobacterium circumlabens]TCN52467.1 outer membrane protein with beta-barrel domain [Flavobacterium circumlabens]TEB45438.1 PorT family protein [Flavobacterium circumlabens]
MKKFLVLAVVTVLGFTNVNAQKIKFGAKGGLNFASVSGDNTEGIDVVTSFNFGVLSEIPVSDKFSFQPELMYSGQGYSFNDNTIALNYLNIPLMGKYYLTKGLSLEAGPQIGFLLSAKNDKTDVKDSFNTFDFGVNFGLGYKLDNGLNFGARYNLGLTDINNLDNSSSKNKNGVFQLSVGYFFF